MIVIDKATAEKLLKKVVEIKGADHTADCIYVQDSRYSLEPGCIVGWVFYEAGATLEQLEALEYESNFGSLTQASISYHQLNAERYGYAPYSHTGIEKALHHLNNVIPELRITDDAYELLGEAQELQDQNHPWGKVLEEVLEEG